MVTLRKRLYCHDMSLHGTQANISLRPQQPSGYLRCLPISNSQICLKKGLY